MIERGVINLSFASSPGAARKVLNQIGSSSQQFYVTRTLHVRNEKEKGPAREKPAEAGATTASPAPAKPASNTAINFIVGEEHIEAAARVELVRFTF